MGIYNHQTKPSMTPTRPAAIPAIFLSVLAAALVADAELADPLEVLLAAPAEVPLAAATPPAPDLLPLAVPVALEPDEPLRLEPPAVEEEEPELALNAAAPIVGRGALGETFQVPLV